MTTDSTAQPADAASFEQFVGQRIRLWLSIVRAMGTDPATAEDIVQETIERLFHNWDKVEAAGSPEAYARRVLTNQVISDRRRRQPRAAAELRLIRQTRVDSEHEPDPADQSADRQALAAELRQLPARQRAVLVLRYYQGLSDAEIADALDCSQGTVRGYASRALATLRIHSADKLTGSALNDSAKGTHS